MTLAMLLAHLVGDYILQWDRLAMWKGRSLAGVTAHCAVVTAVTALFALPFQPYWWEGVLLISIGHYLIDAVQLPLTRKGTSSGAFAFGRFLADQLAHLLVITTALMWGGYLTPGDFSPEAWQALGEHPWWLAIIAYTCLAMPAWVLIEFAVFGLVKGSPPDFSQASNKYISTLERWLMMTFVLTGQLLLVPLVAAPRLLFEMPQMRQADTASVNLYLGKLLASIFLAVLLGLAVRLVVLQ
jgi:hypothetical protein